MSYEPLHHKYRPQTFADLVGQEAIATTLTNAIRTERIAPAYLFTGSRGTGKTSSARILAKSLNCKKQNKPTESPCGECEVCTSIASGSPLDVVEIDAASNTGVDNIREIIERAQFAPIQCRYKVYIIDEVHMLSTAAFNALLKTLEEPPTRVVFVLATTDPQRVLPTIISRCQKFDFRRIPLEAMVKHLLYIASQENINITTDAITLVAQVAQGGLRDAESLLDQLSLLPGEVTVESVWDLVGAVPEQDLMALTQAIAEDNCEAVLDLCRRLMDRGREPLVVLQNLAGFYRDLLIAKTAPNRNDLVALTPPTWKQLREFAQKLDVSKILLWSQSLKNSETQIKTTTQPRLWLEVTLLSLLTETTSLQQPSPVKRQESQTRHEPESSPPTTDDHTQHQQPDATTAKVSPASSSALTPVQPATSTISAAEQPSDSQQTLDQVWKQVLKHLHPFAAHALVSQHCYLLSFEDGVALVGISSQRLLKLAQEKMPNLEAAFEAVCKYPVKVSLSLQPKLSKHSNTDSTSGVSVSTTALENSVVESSPSSRNSDTSHVALRVNQPDAKNPESPTPETFSKARVYVDTPSVGNSRKDNPRAQAEAAYKSDYQRVSAEPSGTVPNEPKSQGTSIDQTSQAKVIQLGINCSLTSTGKQVLPELKPQAQVEVEADYDSLTTAVSSSPSALSVSQEVDSEAAEVEKALQELKQFFEGEFFELTDEVSAHESLTEAGYASLKGVMEQAANHQMQSNEIADFDQTQKSLRWENLQYDEDGDLAF